MNVRVHLMDHLCISTALHRCIRSYHTDFSVCRSFYCRPRARNDHTDDRNIKFIPNRIQSQCTCRIAGNNNGLDLFCFQETDDLLRKANNIALGFTSVWNAGSVTKIYNISCGSCRVISRTTVSPPTPESNTPIGAFFFSHSILIIFSPRLQTILRFYTDTPELSSSWTMPDQYRNLHIFHPGIRLHGWIFLRTVSQLPVPPL